MGFGKVIKRVVPEFVRMYLRTVRKRGKVGKVSKTNRAFLSALNTKPRKDTVSIVFVCQLPSLWNSLESLYSESVRNDRVRAYIVALPERRVGENPDGSEDTDYGSNEAFAFLAEKHYPVINGYDPGTGAFFDIRSLDPDFVFLPRPYDSYLPPGYRSGTLVQFTRVCYVNYGFNTSDRLNAIVYSIDFFKNVYAVFPESLHALRFVKRLLRKYRCTWNNARYEGYPGFDLIDTGTTGSGEKRVFLWTPRWTTDEALLGSNFFLLKDQLFSFFAENRHLSLLFRPHPLLIRNFLATGELSDTDVRDIEQICDRFPNIVWDKSVDYLESFGKADALITDPSSLLVEFFFTGKPVIFCGAPEGFIDVAEKMAGGFYIEKDWNAIESRIRLLARGVDEKSDLRASIVTNSFPGKGVGERILQSLLDDHFAS
jgi:hypothetical protein